VAQSLGLESPDLPDTTPLARPGVICERFLVLEKSTRLIHLEMGVEATFFRIARARGKRV